MNRNGFIEILAVGVFMVLTFFVGRWTAPETMPLVVTEYATDTVMVSVNVPVREDTIIYRDIPQDIDSLSVALEYYADHPFTISVEADQVKVEGKGVISQNSIDTLFLEITNNRPTAIFRPEYKNSLMIGAEAGNGLLAFKAGYRYKNWEVGLGYDILNENQIGLLAEVKYRLKNW